MSVVLLILSFLTFVAIMATILFAKNKLRASIIVFALALTTTIGYIFTGFIPGQLVYAALAAWYLVFAIAHWNDPCA